MFTRNEREWIGSIGSTVLSFGVVGAFSLFVTYIASVLGKEDAVVLDLSKAEKDVELKGRRAA